jgi:hypothetical protein
MRLAVVCSGWHYPESFYRKIKEQKLPDNWSLDLFCISHREPKYAKIEKENRLLSDLDKLLYTKIIDIDEIKSLGWNYKEYPNLIGDWGCSNQWLKDYDYKIYDLLLFTHDDNLILSGFWFYDIINDIGNNWEICSNSCGHPVGWLRGSCEFFKPSLLDKIGGRFDLSKVKHERAGQRFGSEDIGDLSDWNNTVVPLMNFIEKNNIKIKFCSNIYRMSEYCLEGERGYLLRKNDERHNFYFMENIKENKYV